MASVLAIGSPEEWPLCPLDLVSQGVEQEIKIPLKNLLIKVVESLKSPAAPFFKCTETTVNGYQACVVLDASTTTYSVEPTVAYPEIKGDPCPSPELAEINAIKKAFDYLGSQRFVRVVDHSSRLAKEYADKGLCRDVNSATYIIGNALDQWDYVIHSYGKFEAELKMKNMFGGVKGIPTEAGEIYGEVSSFLGNVLKDYNLKFRDVHSEWKEFEAERKKYLEDSSVKYNNLRLKGLRQIAEISEKDVLSYVLTDLQLKQAKYANERVESGYIGSVSIYLPYIEEIGCGGKTIFRGGERLMLRRMLLVQA